MSNRNEVENGGGSITLENLDPLQEVSQREPGDAQTIPPLQGNKVSNPTFYRLHQNFVHSPQPNSLAYKKYISPFAKIRVISPPRCPNASAKNPPTLKKIPPPPPSPPPNAAESSARIASPRPKNRSSPRSATPRASSAKSSAVAKRAQSLPMTIKRRSASRPSMRSSNNWIS